jgi:hypothetical protein
MNSVSLRNGNGSGSATTSPGGTSSVTVNGVTKTSGGGGSTGPTASPGRLGPALSVAGKSLANMPDKPKLEALGRSVAESSIANGQTTGLDALIKQKASTIGGGPNKPGAGESIVDKLSAELARLQEQISQLKSSA